MRCQLRIGDGHLLAAALHDAFVFPGAHQPADRVERAPCHLRYVLPRDGEVDLDAFVGLAAGARDCNPGQAAFGQHRTTQSTAATAVAG